jgi:hypothetical protein
MNLTDIEMLDLSRTDKRANVVRRIFATYAARLSALIDESDCETREEVAAMNRAIMRLEFEAVETLGRAFGTLMPDLFSASASAGRGSDPEGLAAWLAGKGGSLPAGSGEPGEGPEKPAGERAGEPPG